MTCEDADGLLECSLGLGALGVEVLKVQKI